MDYKTAMFGLLVLALPYNELYNKNIPQQVQTEIRAKVIRTNANDPHKCCIDKTQTWYKLATATDTLTMILDYKIPATTKIIEGDSIITTLPLRSYQSYNQPSFSIIAVIKYKLNFEHNMK